MRITRDMLSARLIELFPGAEIIVEDTRGDGYHYDVTIAAPQFVGLARLQQHRLVYAGLADWVGNQIHALSLNTIARAIQ
jgi:stress-induced morphogen